MIILILSGANSPHTLNWANSLSEEGHFVYVASQHQPLTGYNKDVNLIELPRKGLLSIFKSVIYLRGVIKRINPDIVHAHRAARYSLIGRLLKFHPLIISVWGSDVYDYPFVSKAHYFFVRSNLLSADAVASTSHCMAKQTLKIAPEIKNIHVTPFGVDLRSYSSINRSPKSQSDKIVIGTVKTMEYKYGIDTLIKSFSILVDMLNVGSSCEHLNIELRLIGGGGQLEDLKDLANRLGVASKVKFIGLVPHSQVPNELERFDIFVALSRSESESFGVAVIEAGAASLPVVVSDAGGLPEVTINNVTGIVVSRDNPHEAATAIKTLVCNAQLRAAMGESGRKHVELHYSRDVCTKKMLDFYDDVLDEFN